MERDTLHQGPIKDAKRVAEKKRLKESGLDPAKEKKRMFNQSEHELQKELKKQYEQQQPLSGEVVTKDGEVVKEADKART